MQNTAVEVLACTARADRSSDTSERFLSKAVARVHSVQEMAGRRGSLAGVAKRQAVFSATLIFRGTGVACVGAGVFAPPPSAAGDAKACKL